HGSGRTPARSCRTRTAVSCSPRAPRRRACAWTGSNAPRTLCRSRRWSMPPWPRRRWRISDSRCYTNDHMATFTQVSDLEQILGEETALLRHQCKTIPKDHLHLPGPDSVDRMFAGTDRPTRVLSSLQALINHGRLAGTGYV